MNIQRNNYEEYFLLYADNELTPTEKIEVELFLEKNEDLREELKLIQLTVAIPDENVQLADKSFLMKDEAFINENNYQKIFVLYCDNELTQSEKLQTEEFIKDHENFKNEFELFAQTKLIADQAICFPDKRQLYKRVKTIPLVLWKSFAAAVFVGFALWIGSSVLYKNSMNPSIVVGKINAPLQKNSSVVPQKNLIAPKNDFVVTSKEAEKKETPLLKTDEKRNQLVSVKNTVAGTRKNNLELPVIAKKEISTSEVAIVEEIKPAFIFDGTKKIIPDQVNAAIYKKQSIPDETITQTASYSIDEDVSNDYVFYNVKMEDFNKSKVGGFLKKIKRVVERNNPVDRLLSNNNETKESYQ
jgi:hypothetical protein